jgi:hypothetical protein
MYTFTKKRASWDYRAAPPHFMASLGYIVSSKPAWSETLSQKTKPKLLNEKGRSLLFFNKKNCLLICACFYNIDVVKAIKYMCACAHGCHKCAHRGCMLPLPAPCGSQVRSYLMWPYSLLYFPSVLSLSLSLFLSLISWDTLGSQASALAPLPPMTSS